MTFNGAFLRENSATFKTFFNVTSSCENLNFHFSCYVLPAPSPYFQLSFSYQEVNLGLLACYIKNSVTFFIVKLMSATFGRKGIFAGKIWVTIQNGSPNFEFFQLFGCFLFPQRMKHILYQQLHAFWASERLGLFKTLKLCRFLLKILSNLNILGNFMSSKEPNNILQFAIFSN